MEEPEKPCECEEHREVKRIVLSDLRLPLVPLPSPRNLRTEDFNKE